jgi:hypothetical protein
LMIGAMLGWPIFFSYLGGHAAAGHPVLEFIGLARSASTGRSGSTRLPQ